MSPNYTDEQLIAYLEDSLDVDVARSIENALRNIATPMSQLLQERLDQLKGTYGTGSHTIGEIWRSSRVSCPSREDLGRFLMEAISPEEARFIEIHLEIIQCEYCRSNVQDLLQRIQNTNSDNVQQRRKQYFQSSVGRIRNQRSSES